MTRARVASVLALIFGACAANQSPPAQAAPSPKAAAKSAPSKASPALPAAAARMQEPGPETRALAKRVGRWDVVATFRPHPNAAPVVTKGLIADREMVGLYLQETMRPAPGTGAADFRRISYLTYSRVEGRYQYVSLDTRMPVGIMPATSFGKEVDGKLTLVFEPLAFVGLSDRVEGHMVRSNYVITRDTDDHDRAQQYWVRSDGSEAEWLAVEYDYTRRTPAAAAHGNSGQPPRP